MQPRQNFADRLCDAVRARKTPLVVGLDPRASQLPEPLRTDSTHPAEIASAYQKFCCEIVDVVAPLVPAVKPQMAFFEEQGPAGIQALWNVVQHCRQRGLMVILDGKRGDIGSTAVAYARAYLERGPASSWAADALTVSPWLGWDSLQPFIEVSQENGAGIFVLVRTSNPGSRDFQSPVADGRAMFERVAELVQSAAAESAGASGYGNVCAVVGATWPEELKRLRDSMPNTIFLVPGFGAQGGTASDVAQAFDRHGMGAIVNSSRKIIFAWESESRRHLANSDWQLAVEQATLEAIEQLQEFTPARNLVDADKRPGESF